MVIKQTDDTTLAITHIYIQDKDIATKYIHALYMTQ